MLTLDLSLFRLLLFFSIFRFGEIIGMKKQQDLKYDPCRGDAMKASKLDVYKGNYYDDPLKCRRCRPIPLECLADFVPADQEIPFNETTRKIWGRVHDKGIITATRRNYNDHRRIERQGYRMIGSSFNAISYADKKIKGPSMNEMFMRQIIHKDDFRTRNVRKKFCDLDSAHQAVITRRPEARKNEPRDYDVYHKLPERFPGKLKTIEIYKTLNHKYPKMNGVSETHEQLEKYRDIDDYRQRNYKRMPLDLGNYCEAHMDRDIGDKPKKGFGAPLPTFDPNEYAVRYERTYNDHYRVPKPYNRDAIKVTWPEEQAYRMGISHFTDLGNERPRGSNKFHDQTAFYEQIPKRRERDPIVRPIGDALDMRDPNISMIIP